VSGGLPDAVGVPRGPGSDTLIGTRLGHFRITARLGAGGMGEVYRAEDTRLGREVAVKVLPQAFVADPERLARFEREARVLATLNHPRIAGIFEVGEEAGTHFLVMELAAGETLEARIARGPLPLEEVLALALQIAEGLEAAHERGVVHRDLKPGNVMVDERGEVKILDFGLAKALTDEAAGLGPPGLSHSPTITHQATVHGQLLGTVAYMSPEQAKGLPADRRSDLWALGVVLWEMLTGRRPFAGGSVSETLAEVLKTDPPWEELPENLPRPLLRLLRRCLERDPRRRLRDAGDAQLELRAALEGRAETEARGHEPRSLRSSLFSVGVAAVAAVLVGLAIGWWLAASRAPREASDLGPRIVSMTQLTDQPGWQRSPALSPDGSQLLYVSSERGNDDIFLLRVGGERAINLTAGSPVDDFDPAFSPDGSSIVFTSQRQGGGIFVMGATGESPRRVAGLGFGPKLSPDGRRILYSSERIENPYSRAGYVPLRVVGLDGSGDRVLVETDAVAGAWSPSGRRVAYWGHQVVPGQRDIWTVSADGGGARPVTTDPATDWAPFWSADGRWLYFLSDRGGSPDLWRVPIDEASGETRGEPQPVTTGIARFEEAAIAGRGDLVALTAIRRLGEIVRVGFDPDAERVTSAPETIYESSHQTQQASVSPDGRWLASRTMSPREAIFVVAADSGERRTLLADGHRNRGPTWSPDGRWLAFYSNRGGNYDLWAIGADGGDLKQITDVSPGAMDRPFFVDGGRRICASSHDGEQIVGGCFDLGPDGIAGVTTPLGASAFQVNAGSRDFRHLSVSPDHRYLGGKVMEGGLEYIAGAYSLEDAELRFARDVDGRPLRRPREDLSSTWIDGTRMFFWDSEAQAARIWDVESGEIRTVEGVPGPGSLILSPDGRTLFVEKAPIESDIWLLRLAEEGGTEGTRR
jgi:eukaryotic-like serine/threonine-protein kinase